MATVPDFADFAGGVLTTTTANANIRDPGRFLLDRPACQVRQSAAQSIANATFVAITFGTEDLDSPAGHHDNVTNNTRFTAQYPGWYQLSGAVAFVANATGQRITRWAVNGTGLNGGDVFSQTTAANDVVAAARTMLVLLNAGDYVELQAWQNAGGALNTSNTAGEQPTMTVTWMRRA